MAFTRAFWHTHVENLLKGAALCKNFITKCTCPWSCYTHNFCYNSNYWGIITNNKHPSSAYNF